MSKLATQLMNFAVNAKYEFKQYTGYNLGFEKILEIMKASSNYDYYVDEVSAYSGYDELGKDSLGLDTAPREMILDDISVALIGETFPIYGDGEVAAQEFYKKLNEYFEK